jgi:penicillin-binding protein 2
MVSSPGIDPNLFDPTNFNNKVLNTLLNDGQQRLLNRAAQSSYPLGSIFKIITMSAALESNLYTPTSTYYCDSYFTELPGETLADWTVAKKKPPSGNLTLVQGLMRSCNPWFLHIGLDLFRQKGAKFISDLARSFGLGSATGIEQVAEDAGNIPDPKTDGDSVQLAYGQGEMLVTPLQVVRFIAAIGNGGTLYRPQIIESMTTSTGVTTYTFSPEKTGILPIKTETLTAVQDGMRSVVKSKLGTAYYALEGLNIPIYGKTGTATTSTDKPHAWFTGYTSTGRTDKTDIAVVVLAENAGEGSEIAAPIFRRVIENYYFGKALKLYPWESEFNVTRTPTLQYTLTPTITPIRPANEIKPTSTPSG